MFSILSPIKTIALGLATTVALSGVASATTYHHWKHKNYSYNTQQPSKYHSNCCDIDGSDFTGTSTSATSGTDLTGERLQFDHVMDSGNGMTVTQTVTTQVSDAVEASFYDAISLDITGDLLTVFSTVPGSFSQYDFNGFTITDIDNRINAFTSFEALDGGDFEGIDTSFDADTLYIDFGDAGTFLCGDHLSFRISTTALPENNTVPEVPLPGALPLMLGSLGFLGFYRARKKS